MHRLSHGGWIRYHLINSIKFVSLHLSRCSAFITMTLLLLPPLVSREQEGNDGSCGGFWETRLGEYTAPSSLSLCQYLHCSRNRCRLGKLRKGLELHYK